MKIAPYKISLLWVPLLLWYIIGFFTTNFAYYFLTVDAIYFNAGNLWRHAQPLYHCAGNGCFVYFPTAAAFFSLFSLLPLKWAEMIFRLISVGVLTWGIFSFCLSTARKHFNLVYFFSILTIFIL